MTPILKPGKKSRDVSSYRPISNLNIIEKVIEQILKDQLDDFLMKTKVITPNHHGGRKIHSTATAKASLDYNISVLREKQYATGVLTTDLSVAYDTVDSCLLQNKLEHIGVRGRKLELLRTYLMGRRAYTEVQGFCSDLLEQPDCSVIQGSKLSTTLYTIYILDMTEIKEILKDPEEFERIVGKPKIPTNSTKL